MIFSDDQKRMAVNAATAGLPQTLIAKILEIKDDTLRKYLRDELDEGVGKRNMRAVEILWEKIEKGETAPLFFYMKTQMGWHERQKIDLDATVEVKGAGVSGLLAAVLKKDANP